MSVWESALWAIANLQIPEAESLLDVLAEKAQGWGEKKTNFFESLSSLDRRLYCPYFEEEKG
jgi:hypothetical protein